MFLIVFLEGFLELDHHFLVDSWVLDDTEVDEVSESCRIREILVAAFPLFLMRLLRAGSESWFFAAEWVL